MTADFVPRVIFQYMPPPLAGEIEDIPLIPISEEEADELGLEISNFYGEGTDPEFLRKFSELQTKEYAKGVLTPQGILPINENYNPFDFWLVHTNFIISEPTFNAIDNFEGIEALIPLTKYRVKVAVGKAFKQGKTMSRLKKHLEKEAETLDRMFRMVYNIIEEKDEA